MRRRALIGIGIGVIGAALALVWDRSDVGELAEGMTYDWRLAARRTPARDDIVIVDINESSVRALAPIVGRWPWPRLIHSGVVNYLARARARVIVYDVQFTEADAQGQYVIGGALHLQHATTRRHDMKHQAVFQGRQGQGPGRCELGATVDHAGHA